MAVEILAALGLSTTKLWKRLTKGEVVVCAADAADVYTVGVVKYDVLLKNIENRIICVTAYH